MKCKLCNTDMLVDKTQEKDDTETFYYLCPNKECTNYGYKDRDETTK